MAVLASDPSCAKFNVDEAFLKVRRGFDVLRGPETYITLPNKHVSRINICISFYYLFRPAITVNRSGK